MYLLFDIGGTHTRLALSEDAIGFTKIEVIHTPKYFQDGLEAIKQFTKGLEIKKIVGGLAGVLDKEKRILLKSNLPEWNYAPLADSLEELFSCDVLLANDSALGALGEATHGAGIGIGILGYITVGTGVGGARIVDGKIDPTTFGFEPGHQIIQSSGNLCPFCKTHGHLAGYISGKALEEIHHKKPEDINDNEVWDEVAKKLAIGLENITVFWSPEAIVIGGSVAKKIPFEKLEEYLEQYLKIFPHPPKLIRAKLEHPGLYGALEYLKQKGG